MEQLELPFPDEPGRHPEVEFLTIAEAAQRVRCCERTVRRAIDNGALRAGRVRGAEGSRGAFRIRPTDVERWVFGDAA